MRFVQIDPSIQGPQRVIRLIELDSALGGNGYIDVADTPEVGASSWYDASLGEFVSAPEFVPTYQQELAELNAAWQAKVESYNRSFALAALSDGLSEEAKKAAIRAAYEVDKAQNTADRAALKVKHGIGGV